MEMSQHDGEDFEKANLLLSKFYIDKVSGSVYIIYMVSGGGSSNGSTTSSNSNSNHRVCVIDRDLSA